MASFLSQMTKRKKNPDQIVRLAHKALLESCPENAGPTPIENKVMSPPQEELCKRLSQMKTMLYGDGEKTDVDEDKAVELSRHIQAEGLMLQLIDKLKIIPFEARKDTALIFNNLIRKNISDFASYVDRYYENIVQKLVAGYDHPDIALNCGSMVRECIRHDLVARRLLSSSQLWAFFDSFVHQPNFDVASDAFNTLRDLLTANATHTRARSCASDFLETHFEEIFKKYEVLLQSDNYVTRRRSLKLLGELLLDRSNFNVMMRFISDKHYLKVIMTMLRDKSASIQFEAFHVFKVFVANPKKPAGICGILYQNREKLVNYLSHFQTEREDVQFSDEKRLLIE
mmetsp:Transcript_24160/g.24427  ORF Transcript_24160/g.24427 Transcript_24160/m.24427 type:complete len:342 (+) Transcript_24160:116-1141(+)